MKSKTIFMYCSLIFLIGFTADTFAQDPVTHRMNQLIMKNDVPGLKFSVIDSDGTQENYYAGYADLERKVLMNEKHTLFSGSIGKTVAVAALMQLVDEGKVELDKKYIEYFPGLNWLKELPNYDQFTVRHLLQHRSGLPRYAFKKGPWAVLIADPDKVWTYKERMEFIFGDEPVHKAGRGFSYSDTGYILLAMLIEKITGNEYYNELYERSIEPLDLYNTYGADRRRLPNLTAGYSGMQNIFFLPRKTVEGGECLVNPQFENAGGGFICSTSDLAKWCKAYFEAELFSDDRLKDIITISPDGKDVFEGWSCGAGAFIIETKYGKTWGHTGLMFGFKSIMLYFPKEKRSVALQMNCDDGTENLGLVGFVEELMDAWGK